MYHQHKKSNRRQGITPFLQRILGGIVPNVCEVCGCTLTHTEHYICLECALSLPRTMAHCKDNTLVHERLARLAPVKTVAAWFNYDHDAPYSAMIRSAKYNDRPNLAYEMGRMFATELLAYGVFDDVDILVPVPLHWFKKLRRGFNQAAEIAKGISHVTGTPVSYKISAPRAHATQTHHSAGQRTANVSDAYWLRDNHAFDSMHLMIVDDIITTGSTIESMTRAIMSRSCPRAISVFALAMTRHSS